MKSLLPLFKKLEEMGDDKPFQLIGSNMFVEPVADREIVSASGIVIATPSEQQFGSLKADRPLFVRVLAVGPGYDDPDDVDGAKIPLDSKPGDIFSVGQLSAVHWFSEFMGIPCGKEYQVGLMVEAGNRHSQHGWGSDEKFDQMHQLIGDYLKGKLG